MFYRTESVQWIKWWSRALQDRRVCCVVAMLALARSHSLAAARLLTNTNPSMCPKLFCRFGKKLLSSSKTRNLTPLRPINGLAKRTWKSTVYTAATQAGVSGFAYLSSSSVWQLCEARSWRHTAVRGCQCSWWRCGVMACHTCATTCHCVTTHETSQSFRKVLKLKMKCASCVSPPPFPTPNMSATTSSLVNPLITLWPTCR